MKHIRKIGEPAQVLTAGFIAADHPVPEGFELVDGPPPPDAVQYTPPSLGDELNAIFESLEPVVQADLSPLKAAVKLELDSGRNAIARLIIERAQIPVELEPVRQQMLEHF